MKIEIYFRDLSYKKKIEVLQAYKINIDAYSDSNLNRLADLELNNCLLTTLNIKDPK